jgi:cardiolipin synthase
MSAPILTVANQLTLLRMGLAPALVVLVLSHEMRWALLVFVVAGVTDLLDGLAARVGHQQTTLGAMLDPVADKILLSSSFVALTWSDRLAPAIPSWLTVITLSRDAIIVVSVAIINFTVGKRVFYPTLLGKLCTGSQLLTVGVVLVLNAYPMPAPWLRAVFLVTMGLTVASALHYTWLASVRRGAPQP